MHTPDHPRRSFLTLGLAGDAGVMFLMTDICDMFETKNEIKGKFKCLLEFHHCGGRF
jgi:hypothetical protein